MKEFIVNYDLGISRKVLAEGKEEAIKKVKNEPAIPTHFWHDGLKPTETKNFEVFREKE